MTKLVKPHPPYTPPRTDSASREHSENEEPTPAKAVAFPSSDDASPSNTPSRPSKFHRFSKLSISSTSSDDNHEEHSDTSRLRKPSLLKTVKRVSSKQLRSISSTLSNSAHRIHLHGHGHRADHSSESSESSQLSEPSHLSQSFDSSHLDDSTHSESADSSSASALSEVAESSETPSTKDSSRRHRRVSLPSFRLLRPSNSTRSRTGSSVGSVGSVPSSVSPSVQTNNLNSNSGFGRSQSNPSISTERNEFPGLSPIPASPSVPEITPGSAATPTLLTPVATSSADGGETQGSIRDVPVTPIIADADAQETQPHPPGLLISVELIETSEESVDPVGVETSSDSVVQSRTTNASMTSLPPLPSSSRSFTSLSGSSFSYTLPSSAPKPTGQHWTDEIDLGEGPGSEDGSGSESESEYEEDEEIESDEEKALMEINPHRVTEGPFISSVFILVPLLSVRRPLGFYLNWWLGRNS
ncbi:hypothetical protein F5878DRAFT_601934 [Lentinula raphanica]|uniref:Uncharacterized protein n=1 Tax=Lentinula raphanica TaxID=153919 RepID=A0AA38PKJ0_9AGAR|nr:hypothetical protein F5878DRAFT_601934 [Lentinula raphanica]